MNKQLTTIVAVAGVLAVLQGCGSTPGGVIDRDIQGRAMVTQAAAPAPSDFPAPERAKWKQGAFPDPENLRKMGAGMGKDQVRELLGWPHFSEGLWDVREWNYVFHFRTGKGTEYITCRYMVRFGEGALSTGGWFDSDRCAASTAVVRPT